MMTHRTCRFLGLILACSILANCGDSRASDADAPILGVPGMIRIPEVRTGYVNILPDEVKAKLDAREDFEIIDVRSPLQYQAGHVPTAVSMPLATLPWAMNGLARDKETVVYCQIGLASVSACTILVAGGFRDVRNMVGGISAWPYGIAIGNTLTVSL